MQRSTVIVPILALVGLFLLPAQQLQSQVRMFTLDGTTVGLRYGAFLNAPGARIPFNNSSPTIGEDFVVATPDEAVGTLLRAGVVRLYNSDNVKVLHTFRGIQANGRFGASVPDGFIDANVDGVGDLIVGAPGENGGDGAVRVFSGKDSSVLYNLVGSKGSKEAFGSTVLPLFDVNSDSVADFAVGAPNQGLPLSRAGAVYVFSGKTGQLLYTVKGTNSDRLGTSMARARDLDNNTIPDFLVGAPGRKVTAGTGTIYALQGNTGAVIHKLEADATLPVGLGEHVEVIRDFTNDGVDDILAAVPASQAFRAYDGRFGAAVHTVKDSSTSHHFATVVKPVAWYGITKQPAILVGSPANTASLGRVEVRDPLKSGAPIMQTIVGSDKSFGMTLSRGASLGNRIRNRGVEQFVVGSPDFNGGRGRVAVFHPGTEVSVGFDGCIVGPALGGARLRQFSLKASNAFNRIWGTVDGGLTSVMLFISAVPKAPFMAGGCPIYVDFNTVLPTINLPVSPPRNFQWLVPGGVLQPYVGQTVLVQVANANNGGLVVTGAVMARIQP